MRRNLRPLGLVVLATIVALIVDFPLIWMVISSFKTYEEIFRIPIVYIPSKITLRHYAKALRVGIFSAFMNSIILAVLTSFLTIAIALLPSYSFSRFHFKGKYGMLISLLITQAFPQIVFVIPMLLTLKRLGLINTLPGVALSYLPFTTPVVIWILVNFFNAIPKDLEEAALVDGCGRLKAFFTIVLPLAAPSIAAAGVYSFVVAWSELMFQLTFLTTPNRMTLSVFLTSFMAQYQTRWGPLFAGCVITSIPPIIFFLILQKYFVKGLTAGAIKG